MNVVIIEDEKAAVRNLIALLSDVDGDIEIIDTLDSISESIEWFNNHQQPDLLFLDIHLADGSAFEIFEEVSISCPIIFTTAYDEYALKAFKVNSIDYILKPIGKEDINKSFQKLKQLQSETGYSPEKVFKNLVDSLKQEKRDYKTHFLIPAKGDKLLPVSLDMILVFYIQDGFVKILLKGGTEHTVFQTLDELAESLDPSLFFRINRQYIISRDAVKDIDLWFNNRLSLNLHGIKINEKILVSRAKVQEFKNWFTGG